MKGDFLSLNLQHLIGMALAYPRMMWPGKVLPLGKKGREFGWRPLFVYFGRCGWKGIGWFLKMRPLRTIG